MSRSPKKSKYPLDPKKFIVQHEQTEKKEKDLSGEDIYREMLRSKSRWRH